MSPLPSKIAQLNDAFRTSFAGGEIVITRGIADELPATVSAILAAVRAFDAFSPDNDPYAEHDFGKIEHHAVGAVFWKIDYYDLTMTAGSEDPADSLKTSRVLTIMLAAEY